MPGREFFTTVTVAEALGLLADVRADRGRAGRARRGARPGAGRRHPGPARRCRASPARPSTATRSGRPTRTAPPRGCRATSTSSARCRWGGRRRSRSAPAAAAAVPTGGVAPRRRRRGRHGRAHPADDARHGRGGPARSRPATALVRADEDVAVGAVLAPAGRPLRAPDLGMLAAAGVTRSTSTRRPLVGDLLHRRRGGAAGDRRAGCRARCATRRPPRWPGWSAEAGGEPVPLGIVRRRRGRAGGRCCATRCSRCDVVVVSAGSSVGARDETAAAVERLGAPGIVCHGLAHPARASRPCWPSAARCRSSGCPATRCRRWSCSGWSACRWSAGSAAHPAAARAERPGPARPAGGVADRPARRGAGAARRDGQDGRVAPPLFGASALLSVLTAADGYVVVPEEATGLDAGAEVDVTLYR